MHLLVAATFYGKKVNYEVALPGGLALAEFRKSLAGVLERAKEARRRELATATPFPFAPFDVLAVQVWDAAATRWRLIEEVCRHMQSVELVDWTQLYVFQTEGSFHREAVDQDIPRPEPLPAGTDAAAPPSVVTAAQHQVVAAPPQRQASLSHQSKLQAPVLTEEAASAVEESHSGSVSPQRHRGPSPSASTVARAASYSPRFPRPGDAVEQVPVTPASAAAPAPRGSAWERSASVRAASLAREVDERSVDEVFNDLWGPVATDRGVNLSEWLDVLGRPDLNLGIPRETLIDVFRKITDVQGGDVPVSLVDQILGAGMPSRGVGAARAPSGSVLPTGGEGVPLELARTTPTSMRELARGYASFMQYLRRKLSLLHEERMVRADLEEAKSELLRQQSAVGTAKLEEDHSTRAVREQTTRFEQARQQTKDAEAREDALKRELSSLQANILRKRNELKTCEDDLLSAERDVSRQTDAGMLIKEVIESTAAQLVDKEAGLRAAELRLQELEAQVAEQRKVVEKYVSGVDRLKYEVAEMQANMQASQGQAAGADARAATLKDVFKGHDEQLQEMASQEADILARLRTLTEVASNARSYEQLEEVELVAFEKRQMQSAAAHQHLIASLSGLSDAVKSLEQLLQDGKDNTQHERSLVLQHVQLKHRKDVLDEQERAHALKREEMMTSTRRSQIDTHSVAG